MVVLQGAGVTIESFTAGEQHEEQTKQLTDYYNSISENGSGNSVFKTILRTKLLSLENVKLQRVGNGYFGINAPISAAPLVAFDFQSQPWQVEALTGALGPSGSLKIPTGVKNSSLLPRDARLPMLVHTASDMFIVGLQALQELGLPGDDSDENPYPFPTLSAYLNRMEGDSISGFFDTSAELWSRAFTAYSITIGRLLWGAEDLAHAFGADCGNEGGCEGLRYKMQPDSGTTSDCLTVGKDSLPLAELSHFNLAEPRQTKWTYLVTCADRLGVSNFDMLPLRRFTNIARSGAKLQSTPNDECNMYADDFIQTVEKNHLYMEESLQTSYTAAFYFLFQDAARHKRMVASSSQSGTSAPYTFAGNVQLMKVPVSIPTANVIVSLIGCFLLLIGSVGIVLLAKRGEHVLQQRANAEIVAEAMMNAAKYPLLLLQMELEQLVGSQESLRFPLQDLRVQSVLLHHNEERKHVFHIGSEM